MTRIALKSGTMIAVNGIQMVFDRELGDQSLIFTRIPTGVPWRVGEGMQSRLPTWADLEAALAGGEFKIFTQSAVQKPYAAPEDAEVLDQRARIRAHYVRAFDQSPVGLGKRSLAKFIEEIAASVEASEFDWAPSPSSLRRWVQYRGTIGDRRTIDMVSMTGSRCKAYLLDQTVSRAIKSCVMWYWSLDGRSITDCYARFRRMIRTVNYIRNVRSFPLLKPPCFETIRRYIRAAECKDTWIARYGARAASMRWGPVKGGLLASTILETAILDHTVFDGVLVLDIERRLPMGRPTLTITIDVFSRCILAWVLSFEPPQIWSVGTSIRMANRPKPWLAAQFPEAPNGAGIFGKMTELVVDNAFEFIGRSIKDGLHDLGISLTFAPIATPEYKAIGERFFETLNTLLVHKLPGAVNVDIETRRLLDLDPAKDAILTLEEVEALINEAINLYHHKVHSTLNAPPALVWAKAAENGVQILPDDSLLTATLGTVRTGSLDRQGIRFMGLRYRNAGVIQTMLDNNFHKVPMRKRPKKSARIPVKFKYESDDLGSIQVYDPSTRSYYKMYADHQRYAAGLSVYQHKLVLELMKQESEEFHSEEQYLAALQRLRTHIEAATPQLRQRARKAAMRLKKRSPKTEIVGDTLAVGLRTEAQLEHFHIPNKPAVAERTDKGLPSDSAFTRKAKRRRQKQPKRADDQPKLPTVQIDFNTFETDSEFLSALNWR